MKRKNLYIIIVLILLFILLFGVLFIYFQSENKEKLIKAKATVSYTTEIVDSFMSNKNSYSELSELAVDEVDNMMNFLNSKVGYTTQGLNYIKDETEKKIWQNEKEKAYEKLNVLFVDGKIEDDSSKLVKTNQNYYYTFKYIGMNKLRYSYYLNELSNLILYDHIELNENEKITTDLVAINTNKANMIAMQLLNDTDFFKETETMIVTVQLKYVDDVYKISNLETVIEDLEGAGSVEFGYFEKDFLDTTFVQIQNDVKEVYNKAVKEGIYNPSNPLSPLSK